MRLNQYFITDDSSVKIKEFNTINFNDYVIYSHENLNVIIQESTFCKLVLLGFIINPFKPELTNQEIIKELSYSKTKTEVLEYIEKCSGRFVLIFNINKETFVVNDFMALRQINYLFKNGFSYISSNEKLLLEALKLKPELNPEKIRFKTDSVFLNIQEHWFLDTTNWDYRIQSVLPNHILSIKTKNTIRIPFYNKQTLNYNDVLNQSSKLLKQSLLAISKRYKISLPITSGYDSRLMLATALSNNLKMKNFIFNRKGTYIKRDLKTAIKLAKTYNLDFKVITPKPLKPKFIKEFRLQFIVPRILQKTQNIQWFKNNKSTKNIINIVGIGGGLLKAFYNNNIFNNSTTILKEAEVNNTSTNHKIITQWLKSAKNYAKEYRINISDLFFLEIRTGLWASKTSLELDYAELEEFSPLNNKYIIYTILKNTRADQRKSMMFYNDLLEHTYLGITVLPLNPKTWRDIIKKIIVYNTYKKWIHKMKYI